jgi:hypothetical protein
VNDRPPLTFDSVRRGPAMFDEINSVAVKNAINNRLESPNPT